MSSWSISEEILALYLYFSEGRKVASPTSTLTRTIARISGKSVDSMVLKTANFRSLDAESKSKGMRNVSTLDKFTWDRYSGDPAELEKFSLDILADPSIVSTEAVLGSVRNPVSYALPDFSSETKRRVGQERVRAMVLLNYGERCCMCGLDHPAVLRASHIIPWSVRIDIRGDPRNVLCLCVLHDLLFDLGFVTVNHNMEIVVAKPHGKHPMLNETLSDLAGKKLLLPLIKSASPKEEYIEYHRKNVFGKYTGN